MFGYLNAVKPELKIREFAAYKAVYCGLCKELGRRHGPFARLNLRFDFVFLAMLGLTLPENEGRCSAKDGRCLLNPLRRCRYVCSCDPLRLAADASVLLTCGKLRDDLRDETILRRLLAVLLLIPFSLMRRRTRRRRPQLDALITDRLGRLRTLESGPDASADACADAFSGLMGDIFSQVSARAPTQRVLRELGYFLGRWIYLCDAVEDFPEDVRKRRFNPLRALLSYRGGDPAVFREEKREELQTLLNETVSRVLLAYELLPAGEFKPQLDNILYLGTKQRMEKIFLPKG